MDNVSADAGDYLAPEQLAVGVQNGASIMIHGIRLTMEKREDFVLIKLDIKNGYNAAFRAAMLETYCKNSTLRPSRSFSSRHVCMSI